MINRVRLYGENGDGAKQVIERQDVAQMFPMESGGAKCQ